jgi:hypothetical protein
MGQIAFCCQNLTLGALSSRNALCAGWRAVYKSSVSFCTRLVCHLKGSKRQCKVHVLVLFESDDDHEPPFCIPTVITTTLTFMNFFHGKDGLTTHLAIQTGPVTTVRWTSTEPI